MFLFQVTRTIQLLKLIMKKYWEFNIQKEFSNLNSKKVGTFRNILTKVLQDSCNSDICNSMLQDKWNYQLLGKQLFPKYLKQLI